MPHTSDPDRALKPKRTALPRGPESNPITRRPRPRRSLIWAVLLLALIAVVGFVVTRKPRVGTEAKPGAAGGRGGMGSLPVPIIPGKVEVKEVPIFLDGLGTVQAFNTVTVHSRIDGQIIKIAFTEGQDVHTGDLLAQLDPAPVSGATGPKPGQKIPG